MRRFGWSGQRQSKYEKSNPRRAYVTPVRRRRRRRIKRSTGWLSDDLMDHAGIAACRTAHTLVVGRPRITNGWEVAGSEEGRCRRRLRQNRSRRVNKRIWDREGRRCCRYPNPNASDRRRWRAVGAGQRGRSARSIGRSIDRGQPAFVRRRLSVVSVTDEREQLFVAAARSELHFHFTSFSEVRSIFFFSFCFLLFLSQIHGAASSACFPLPPKSVTSKTNQKM